MRVGLSWDLGGAATATDLTQVPGEAATAARFGYDSVWIRESRDSPGACPHPALLLTALARKAATIQLRSIREVVRANPVRIAEETAVLDVFSRGRAGIAFAAGSRQGRPPAQVHETIDFVRAAWAGDEMRYRGSHVRFPAHTEDSAPAGASYPPPRGDSGGYVPQWEWGPATPDFLTITPKPYCARPPVYVEIEDDVTLDWAAAAGISPFVAADVPVEAVVERLGRYREVADAAGRSRAEIEVVIERVIRDRDAAVQVAMLRDLQAETGLSHLVWRREGAGDADLFRFAADVYPLLQG